MSQLKVKSDSKPKSIAGAITGMLRDGATKVEIVVIGASALNQAVKAITIARGFLTSAGINIAMVPSFVEVSVGEEKRTAMRLDVQKIEK